MEFEGEKLENGEYPDNLYFESDNLREEVAAKPQWWVNVVHAVGKTVGRWK